MSLKVTSVLTQFNTAAIFYNLCPLEPSRKATQSEVSPSILQTGPGNLEFCLDWYENISSTIHLLT